MKIDFVTDPAELGRTVDFWRFHAKPGLRYPRDPELLIKEVNEGKTVIIAVMDGGEIQTVAWVAKKPQHIFLVEENACLILRSSGPFVDSGGWLNRKGSTIKGAMGILARAVHHAWFNLMQAPEIWGRMVGVGSEIDGVPAFWHEFGRTYTGLDYFGLLEMPFGEAEQAILGRWPKQPLPLSEIPEELLWRVRGVTTPDLERYEQVLGAMAMPRHEDLFVPTSLNLFLRSDPEILRSEFTEPERILDLA